MAAATLITSARPRSRPTFRAPTKHHLVIYLKTVKALGLDLSLTMLTHADEVIE